MSRLVLIDGSSYLYRAFHALPPLTNAQGEPTGALFGVVNMLRATLKERPAYIAFVVDAPGKTFRDALYADYKANRPSMPDDLRAQVQPMCDIVHALGIDILRIDGVEADDVIGTLALQAAADGLSVTISTGDKDFAQLVRPGIELVNTMSGSRMDSDAAVIAKFGVRPDQIVDLLALMGDTVDNVPGVEKCGPKTAAKWLAEYDSLDGVIANADKIKGKIGDNLRAALPRLPLNRELVTIKIDVTLASGPRALDLREPNTETLAVLYARYGFTQALRELGGALAQSGLLSEPVALGAAAATARTEPGRARGTGFVSGPVNAAVDLDPALSAPGAYETILTQEQLDSWIAQLRAAGQFAFDTETDSLDPLQADLIGLSVAAEPGKAAYLPFGHNFPGAPVQLDRTHALAQLAPLLTDPAVRKVGQHGKYDLHVMRRHGVELAGYADDTLLESFVLNSGSARHDMDSLAKRYLGYDTVKYEDVCGKGAKQIPFARSAWTMPPATPPKTPTSPCACITCSAPSWQPSPAWSASTATSKCHWWTCWRASKPTACAWTPPNYAVRARTCPSACSPPSKKPPSWQGAPSTWIRPSSCRRCCSTSSSSPPWSRRPRASPRPTKTRWKPSPTSTSCRG